MVNWPNLKENFVIETNQEYCHMHRLKLFNSCLFTSGSLPGSSLFVY